MRSRFSRVVLAGLPASLAACLVAAPARAQTAAPGVTTFDAVTVTATKTPHARDEVPASVEVMDSEALEERQPQTMDDIFRTMPGLESSGGPRRSAQDVTIRGVGGQRVLVTIDGARQNFNAGHKGRMFIDPDLLKQVEVLKGPNSSLHGAGAIGGKVSMTTRDAADFLQPGQTFGAQAKFGFASAQREPLYGLTLFARPGDGIDVLASGTYRRTGTLQTGGGTEIVNTKEEMGSQLFKFGVDIDPNQRVSFSAQQTLEDGNTPINTSADTAAAASVAERDTDFHNYTLNYRFTEPGNRWLDMKVVIYHSNIEIDEVRKSDGRFDESDLATTGFDVFNTSRPGRYAMAEHALTYGVEFYRDDQVGRRNGAARPEFPESVSDVLGVYLQDEMKFAHGVTLTPSLRFDSYAQEAETNTADQSESKVSPRLGAVWQATPWGQLFGNYGQAFRAPSLTELFVSGTHFPGNTFVSNTNLKPEKSEGYEVGGRMKFSDVLTARDRVRFSMSWFDTDYEDFIETIVTATTTTPTNITNANIYGGEAELAYDGPVMFGAVSLSYVRGTDEDTNQPLESIPADKAVLTVGARVAPWDMRFGWRSELVDAQDRTRATTATNGTPAAATGGYAVHGIFASWQPDEGLMKGLRINAGIDNLLDKNYRRHQATIPEEGRDFHASVSYLAAF